MDVAEAHLARQGYMGVSLEAIAGEVGVSKPALYYHFPGGKEQLFVEIAHRSLDRIRAGLESSMGRAGSGAGKLSAAARWLMGFSAFARRRFWWAFMRAFKIAFPSRRFRGL